MKVIARRLKPKKEEVCSSSDEDATASDDASSKPSSVDGFDEHGSISSSGSSQPSISRLVFVPDVRQPLPKLNFSSRPSNQPSPRVLGTYLKTGSVVRFLYWMADRYR